jgi:hypothetical protein
MSNDQAEAIIVLSLLQVEKESRKKDEYRQRLKNMGYLAYARSGKAEAVKIDCVLGRINDLYSETKLYNNKLGSSEEIGLWVHRLRKVGLTVHLDAETDLYAMDSI